MFCASWYQAFSLLKITLLHGCFSRFLNCTNGTKLRRASHIFCSFMEKQCFFVNIINIEKFLFKIKIANCPLNAIRIWKFLMPHFPFVGRWIKNIRIKRYIWQFMITGFFEERNEYLFLLLSSVISQYRNIELFKIWLGL